MKSYLLLILLFSLQVCTVPQTQPQEQVYTADDDKQPYQEKDPIILKEIENSNAVELNSQNFHEYSFILDSNEDQQFVFAVDNDEDIKARMVTYWKEGETFISSKVQKEEEIRVLVYEDNNRLVGNWGFYYTTGIAFHAKKQHQYLMKIYTKSRTKLITMDLEHMTYRGSTSHAVNTTHIQSHQRRIKLLKQKLLIYVKKIEANHILNHWIGENVRLHMSRYIWYQGIESVVIFGFALAQAYFIRSLLSKGYSIV